MIAIPDGSGINYKFLRKNKSYLRFRIFYNSLYFIALGASLYTSLLLPSPYKPWWGYFLGFSFFSTWLVYIIKTVVVSTVFGKEAYKPLR